MMKKMRGIKFNLPQRARFHFADSKGNLKRIFSSDQLFAAIINNAALLYNGNEVNEIVDHFVNNKFIISSLYYGLDIYSNSEEELVETIYFLPKPFWLIRSDNISTDDFKKRKKFKKVSFISVDVYQKLLDSWDKEEEYFNFDLLNLPTIGDRFAVTKEELAGLRFSDKDRSDIKFISSNTYQKLQVNRLNNGSENTYYQNELEISHLNIGEYLIKPFMFFMYRGDLSQKLYASLRLLVEEGLGGKRSRGLGYLNSIEKIELPLSDKGTGDRFISMSTVYPNRDELDYSMSYQLRRKDGYIYDFGGTPFRRKTIRLMSEGSMFSRDIKGQVVDVTPEDNSFKCSHDILVNGKAFLLGFGG